MAPVKQQEAGYGSRHIQTAYDSSVPVRPAGMTAQSRRGSPSSRMWDEAMGRPGGASETTARKWLDRGDLFFHQTPAECKQGLIARVRGEMWNSQK